MVNMLEVPTKENKVIGILKIKPEEILGVEDNNSGRQTTGCLNSRFVQDINKLGHSKYYTHLMLNKKCTDLLSNILFTAMINSITAFNPESVDIVYSRLTSNSVESRMYRKNFTLFNRNLSDNICGKLITDLNSNFIPFKDFESKLVSCSKVDHKKEYFKPNYVPRIKSKYGQTYAPINFSVVNHNSSWYLFIKETELKNKKFTTTEFKYYRVCIQDDLQPIISTCRRIGDFHTESVKTLVRLISDMYLCYFRLTRGYSNIALYCGN